MPDSDDSPSTVEPDATYATLIEELERCMDELAEACEGPLISDIDDSSEENLSQAERERYDALLEEQAKLERENRIMKEALEHTESSLALAQAIAYLSDIMMDPIDPDCEKQLS